MTSLLESVSVSPETGRPIYDVSTQELIGYSPKDTIEDLESAVTAAKKAQPGWASLGHAERSRILHNIANDLERHAEELGAIITAEQGKAKGAGEVHGAVHWIRSTADMVINPEVLSSKDEQRTELQYVPLGIVASIGPWNFPVMTTVWHIAPALRMGNGVIVKPSENTPLCVRALLEIFNRHLPEGVAIPLFGNREVSAALASHTEINKIVFTGSTATGRKIIQSSANNIARLTLELGGNDPGIILPGTNVEEVADRLFWSSFMNTGQVCAALKRLYVHDSIYDEVIDALAERARNTPMGSGHDKSNQLGPVQNESQLQIIERLVDDARERGARIVTGGERDLELGPLFYKATIVADIENDAALVREEQFGPALPIVRYREVAEAIALANASDLGLGASVWGSDTKEAAQLAVLIESGTVWINQHGGVDPSVPFGGRKASGYGLEFSIEGLKAMAATQVIRY